MNYWTIDALCKAGKLIGRDGKENPFFVVDGSVWLWDYEEDTASGYGNYSQFMEDVRDGQQYLDTDNRY